MGERGDPVAEAMARLLGDGAAAILQPALPSGATLRSLRARQVLLRPQRRVAVTYLATLEWGDGVAVEEFLVAVADHEGPPRGATTSMAGEHPVAVWRAPQDPQLPGLRPALDPAFAHRLLVEAGVRARTATVRLRAYRPGRRAVVEIRPVEPEQSRIVFSPGAGGLRAKAASDAPGLYLKVLPPERAAEVAEVHRRLGRVVPVAPCTLVGEPGVLRLGALPGASLGASLRRGRVATPSVDDLLELLARLESAALPGAGSPGSDARLRRHVRLLRALVPEEDDRLKRLRSVLEGAREQPAITIHGDFHEGNVLVGDEGIRGLLDVDDAGPGERVDDLGLLAGRLWSLGQGEQRERAMRYAEELLRRSDDVVDPAELRRRVGVALVGRATAPFRNQLDGWRPQTRERLELAERWVTSIAPMLP